MQRPGGGRIEHIAALDGLRGLAALVVVLRHCFNTVSIPISTREAVLQSPLALLLNGQGAVQLFFVLSGFVLAASLERNRYRSDLAQFFAKRVFRIHPPYVFAVLLAWTAAFVPLEIAADSAVMPGVRRLAAVHIDGLQLLGSLLFPGPAHGQLPVGWTLRVEMVFSFLLPLMVWLARRTHWMILVVGCAGLLWNADHLTMYAIDFALGIGVAVERDRIRSWATALPSGLLTLGALSSLFVLHAPLLLGWSVPARGILIGGFAPADIAVMGVGAAGLVSAALCVRWLGEVLATRPLRFLGRISYSLYLVHGVVLLQLTPILSGPPDPWMSILYSAGVVAGSLGLATLGYHWVERPSIRAGNLVCRRIAARAGTDDVGTKLVPG